MCLLSMEIAELCVVLPRGSVTTVRGGVINVVVDFEGSDEDEPSMIPRLGGDQDPELYVAEVAVLLLFSVSASPDKSYKASSLIRSAFTTLTLRPWSCGLAKTYLLHTRVLHWCGSSGVRATRRSHT